MTDTAHAARCTAEWLRSDQAALMTQMDEQVRGSDSGLVPGENNAAQFHSWIAGRYGPLPTIRPTPKLTATAHIAAQLCHWRADRLVRSVPVTVDSDAAHAAKTLAAKQVWLIPPLPELSDFTIFWRPADAGYSRFHTVDTGSQDVNSCIAVTITAVIHRLMEWSASPSLESLEPGIRRLLEEGRGTLPPLILEGDSFYPRTQLGQDEARQSIVKSMALPVSGETVTTVNATAALLTGIIAGLFTLEQPACDGEPWQVRAPHNNAR